MVEYFLASFSGYAIGRLGHIFGGSIWWIPHHWIFGVILMVAPFFLKKIPWAIKILIIVFALGVFISDFNDFLSLKTFEPEDVEVVRFWGVD
jgi:hypothetical protein